MQKTMLAVVKPEAAPGTEIREVKVPAFGRNDVLVKGRPTGMNNAIQSCC